MQLLQHQAEMVKVCLLVQAGNENVVQVHTDKVQASHQPVHQTLERLGNILKAEEHAQELPEAERSNDGDVLGPHWHLVVSLAEIQLAEHRAAMQPAVKSWMFRRGYLSALVTLFSLL